MSVTPAFLGNLFEIFRVTPGRELRRRAAGLFFVAKADNGWHHLRVTLAANRWGLAPPGVVRLSAEEVGPRSSP